MTTSNEETNVLKSGVCTCNSYFSYIYCPILKNGGITGYAFYGTDFNIPFTARNPTWMYTYPPSAAIPVINGSTAGIFVPIFPQFTGIYSVFYEGDPAVPIITYGQYQFDYMNGQSYAGNAPMCTHSIATGVTFFSTYAASNPNVPLITIYLQNAPSDTSDANISVNGTIYTGTSTPQLSYTLPTPSFSIIASFKTGGNPSISFPPIYQVTITVQHAALSSVIVGLYSYNYLANPYSYQITRINC